MKIIEQAVKKGAKNLSEYESKQVLAAYGIPITAESIAKTEEEAVSVAASMGYPVALKASGDDISHKTEHDLILLDVKGEKQVRSAYNDLISRNDISVKEILVQQMVKGNRELMAGLKRDNQFGACVVFGLGGVLAEILEDISIRVAPLSQYDAMDMMENIKGKKILDAFRGKPPVNRKILADLLINLGSIGLENKAIKEIDVNPIKLVNGKPIAVDALIVLEIDKP